jgi:hypothetical protein
MVAIRRGLGGEARPDEGRAHTVGQRTAGAATPDDRRRLEAASDLRGLPLDVVAAACREERGRRRRGEAYSDVFDMELFRRAICDRDGRAWEKILDEYRGLLVAWVHRHPAYVAGSIDSEDVAIRALARFWKAIGPERLTQFASISPILQYLKMCVHSIVLDEARALHTSCEPVEEEHDIEALAVDQIAASQLWDAIRRVLEDSGERQVVYLSFTLGMKPGAICARHPERFGSVANVYQVKRNALDRLRRSPEINRLLAVA